MLLTIKDWGLLKAKPSLVDRVVSGGKANTCSKLNMYREITGKVVGMFRAIDGIQKPSSYPATTHLADDHPRVEQLTSQYIKELDIDLQGFMLKPDMQSITIDDVASMYARMVMGHEMDADCERILGELGRANLRVKVALTCR